MKIKYNGVNLNDEFECFVVDRPLPEFRATGTTIYGVDGESFESATYGTREITIAVYAIDKTQRGLQRAARRLMEIVATHEEKKLVIGDERDFNGYQLYRKVVPIGVPEFTPYVHAGRFLLRFKQFDPFLYGNERVKRLEGNNIPLNFDAGGNVEAWPIIKVTPPRTVNTLELYKVGSGERITFNGAIGGRDLVINTKKQTVKVDGSGVTEGNGLMVGSRFFSISGKTSIISNSPGKISWDERWL